MLASGDWNRAALLRGYQNAMEIAAREVRCTSLPSDLVGTYYRNGHARFTGYDGETVAHHFDADGMVTAVTLDGRTGIAVVRQRYVATTEAIAERQAGRRLYPGIFGNSMPLWAGGAAVKNLANTAVLYHGEQLLALWEGSRPYLLDPLSLATRHEWNVDGLIGRTLADSFSAHPRPTTSGLCNFASTSSPLTGQTTVRCWDFARDGFSLQAPPAVRTLDGHGLYHDFLVTDSWYIFVAPPARWSSAGSPMRSVRGVLEWARGQRPLTSMVEFDEALPTVAHFIRRRPVASDSAASSPAASSSTVHATPTTPAAGTRVADLQTISVELDTFFCFHHANAFEDPTGRHVTFHTAHIEAGGLPRFDQLKREDEVSTPNPEHSASAAPLRLSLGPPQ